MEIEFVVSTDSTEKLDIVSRLIEKIGCKRTIDRTIGDGAVLCRSFVAPNIIDDDIDSTQPDLLDQVAVGATLRTTDDSDEDDAVGGAFGTSTKRSKFPNLDKLQSSGIPSAAQQILGSGAQTGILTTGGRSGKMTRECGE